MTRPYKKRVGSSSSKPCLLENEETGECLYFTSAAEASRYLGIKSHKQIRGYLDGLAPWPKIKRNNGKASAAGWTGEYFN